MQRVILGTAGHIDHGKTTLLKALTGTDCDRWAEEKARGITIDIGFAHLEADDLQVGFIDVPGHERFLHNALAGLGGIRLALLVVAADEGVKPQTREHVAICSLLGIPRAVVALTKIDLADDDLAELARMEVEELLETTPFAGAAIHPVSSTTGQGIDALRGALIQAARDASTEAPAALPLRLPVDRSFHLKGLGVVITGTLITGTINVGDRVEVLAADREPDTARIRSIQVHGEGRPTAQAGERTALQLTGVDLNEVGRGAQLVQRGVLRPSKTLCARFTLLADAPEPIDRYVPIRLHLYSTETVGTLRPLDGILEPGESGLVEIRLAEPVVAIRGDRFIIRRPSPAFTLGGGEVLDPHWRRRRGKLLEIALGALPDDERALRLWVSETSERGLATDELTHRLGVGGDEIEPRLDHQVEAGKLIRVDPGRGTRYLSPDVVQRVIAKGRRVLGKYLAEDRLSRGMPKAQFLGSLLHPKARDMADTYLKWLVAESVLVVTGDVVNPPGRTVELTGEESTLARELLAAVEAERLTPPSPAEFAARLDTKPQIVEGVVRYLLDQGKLVTIPGGLILSSVAIDQLRSDIAEAGWDAFGVGEFKNRFGFSRKWAIPLLEHLDSIGATRRVGDKRQLVQR